MVFDLRDALEDAKRDAPAPRRSVDDIVAAGRSLQRRRRFTWMTGGAAAVTALAVASAVTLSHVGSASSGPAGTTTAAGSHADAKPLTFPALSAPFMYSLKGYSVGPIHVSDPVFATATYQESRLTLDGVRKQRVENSTGTWKREYDVSVGTLTVYRPGVFSPDKFKGGTAVTVRGLPGLQTEFTDVAYDAVGRNKKAMPSSHPVKVAALAWQYASGAWATLVTNPDFQTANPAGDLLKVADGLTPAPPVSAPVPYRLPKVPAGYHLVAIGSFDPTSMGDDLSEAYFAKGNVPMDHRTDRLTALDLENLPGGALKIIVAETAPAAPTDPYPHPNPAHPCQPGFCDRAINSGYFAEILEGRDRMDVVHSVTNGLVFDNPADPATWHTAATFAK